MSSNSEGQSENVQAGSSLAVDGYVHSDEMQVTIIKRDPWLLQLYCPKCQKGSGGDGGCIGDAMEKGFRLLGQLECT